MRVVPLIFTLLIAGTTAAPTLAAPFGWENGESRGFSFTTTDTGYEFWLQGFGAHDYDTLDTCCTTAFAAVVAAHPEASLRFWNLSVNGYFVSSEFHDGLDMAYFRSAIGPLNDVHGSVQLSWPDYAAQVLSIGFTIEDPPNGNVPEPMTLALVCGGLAGLSAWRLRRRR